MSSLTNPIQALARRFASLPPSIRMEITKKLLDPETGEQTSMQPESAGDSSGCVLRKSFLERFWDEVERAHGDHLYPVNPFINKRVLKALANKPQETAGEQGVCLPWHLRQSNLIAQF